LVFFYLQKSENYINSFESDIFIPAHHHCKIYQNPYQYFKGVLFMYSTKGFL